MASLGRVLIVEDEPRVALLLHDTLQDFGYDVRVAVDGHEALRHWKRGHQTRNEVPRMPSGEWTSKAPRKSASSDM